jgi:hypothetical protein
MATLAQSRAEEAARKLELPFFKALGLHKDEDFQRAWQTFWLAAESGLNEFSIFVCVIILLKFFSPDVTLSTLNNSF